MRKEVIRGFVFAAAAAGLFVSGCASVSDVERAQATADSAHAAAQQAQGTASSAQQSASAAQSTAEAAQSTANSNSAKIDTLVAYHKGPRG